jgi:hypothetical protein
MPDPQREQLISDLVNALQTALLLTARLDGTATDTARDAQAAHAAVSRAAAAAQQLRPDHGRKGE